MPVSRRSRLPPSIMPKPPRVRKARAVPATARDRQVSRQLGLLGNVQHLELVQEPVDMPNPVSARIAQLALRLPSLALRGDLDRGLLDHASAAEGTSHASRTTTLRSNTELVKNLNPARRPTRVALQCHTSV